MKPSCASVYASIWVVGAPVTDLDYSAHAITLQSLPGQHRIERVDVLRRHEDENPYTERLHLGHARTRNQ